MSNLKSKKFSLLSLCFFLFFFAAGITFAAEQTTCPVMGGTIDKKLYTDYKGQRVYFCCMACPSQFAKDPEKYIKKLKEMGQEPEKIGTNNQG